MTDRPARPFVIAKDENGQVRLTVWETRHDSQGYLWVTNQLVEQPFASTSEARSYAVEEFGAKPGEFASR